jgi:hypothetical protein
MADGTKKSFLITGGLIRQEGESDKEFAQRRHKAVQQHYGRMSREERLQAALADGGLVRLEGESEEDFIRLSHQFVVRGVRSPLTLSEFEQNIRVLMEAAAHQHFGESIRRRHKKDAEWVLTTLIKEEEFTSLVGDLLEEYSQLSPQAKADVWLFKQVVKSIIPLMCKVIKSRLASYYRG